jgi:hypothetical protein
VRKDLKPQIKKIKELFAQFEEKEMPEVFQSEKSDKKHHNGTGVKRLIAKGKDVKSKDLKKIAKVQYAGRTLRSKAWVDFRDDGSVRKAGLSRSSKSEPKRIYVMDRYGQFYQAKDYPGNAEKGKKATKHSTFFNGRPVAGAGKKTLNNGGVILRINNDSGHYEPGKAEMIKVLKGLKRHGADLSKIEVDLKTKEGTQQINAAELLKA